MCPGKIPSSRAGVLSSSSIARARRGRAHLAPVRGPLTGAGGLVAHAEQTLECKSGESTADGRIFLKRGEECVAACTGAPVMLVNGHYHEKLDAAKVDAILDGLE